MCIARDNGESCSHTECPFPDFSGYECVDIWAGKCESGRGCSPDCQWSFTEQEAPAIEAAQLDEIDMQFGIE